jgi:mRNA-degrading endonuclease RelE of RelBE toxin-antitoxin system
LTKKPHCRLRIQGDILNFIGNLHPEIKRKIRAGLETISVDPCSGKALKADLTGLFSFRVGRITIVYRVPSNRVIEIVAIGPRKSIYEETFRLIKKIS